MDKYASSNCKECAFEEMSDGPSGQSMPAVYDEAPMVNEYENVRKSFMGPNGFDWSAMQKGKR